MKMPASFQAVVTFLTGSMYATTQTISRASASRRSHGKGVLMLLVNMKTNKAPRSSPNCEKDSAADKEVQEH